MIPVLPPSAIAQELTACTVLGGCTGVVRAVFPVRGRAAWVPDFLWVGREGFAAADAPACRTAACPAAKCPQITPQRKKNRKKAQKELAKPAPDDV